MAPVAIFRGVIGNPTKLSLAIVAGWHIQIAFGIFSISTFTFLKFRVSGQKQDVFEIKWPPNCAWNWRKPQMMPAGRRLVFFFVEKEPSYRPNFFWDWDVPCVLWLFYLGIYYLFSHMLEVPDPLFPLLWLWLYSPSICMCMYVCMNIHMYTWYVYIMCMHVYKYTISISSNHPKT